MEDRIVGRTQCHHACLAPVWSVWTAHLSLVPFQIVWLAESPVSKPGRSAACFHAAYTRLCHRTIYCALGVYPLAVRFYAERHCRVVSVWQHFGGWFPGKGTAPIRLRELPYVAPSSIIRC